MELETQALEPIPSFTAEDFATVAPYQWLLERKSDIFQHRLLLDGMKAHAASVGVRNFVQRNNDFLRAVAKRGDIQIERMTEFDGQPFALKCGSYIADDDGIRYVDHYGAEVMVCPHPIMPSRRLINVDTGEESIELVYRKGSFWRPPIIVEKSVIASSQRIIELAAFGVIVTSESAKALSSYLFKMEELNYKTLDEKRSVGRLGWIPHYGFSPYMDELEFDGETNYRMIFNHVHEQGDRQEWLDIMRKCRAEKTVARIFLAASFASAILEPCGLLPFVVHLWGGSGGGKTVSLMIATSVWASPHVGDYISTFNATDVGQEMMASFLNSLPYCMDELQIQASNGQVGFDRMIYKLTEGVGRTRGAKAGGLRQTSTWRNCIMTTGEFPIISSNSMSGATVRVIEIECDKPAYSDLVGLCNTIQQNYGYAGKEFVRWLQDPANMEAVKGHQKEIYKQLLCYDGTEKQALSMSAILTADHFATELIFQDRNELTVEDLTQYITSSSAANANISALDYIYDLVARNPGKFQPNEAGTYQGECWGKFDGSYIYIIKSILDRELGSAGFNARAFLSWAARQYCDNGQPLILASNEDGWNRKARRVRINGTLSRVICIAHEWKRDTNATKYDTLPF